MALHIGTSGWSYDHWEGLLYPPRTGSRRRLDYYSARFDTVEVNSTFYRWPGPATFAAWRERVPDGFRFSIKASRGLTHRRRLRDPESWIERITAGLRELRDRFSMLLIQLPPRFPAEAPRLDRFLASLPGWIRCAVEFRDSRWLAPEVVRVLRRRGAACCLTTGPESPPVDWVTAPFVYVRFHGPAGAEPYGGSYSGDELDDWARRIRGWDRAGLDVYAYFNNDREGHAVRDAEALLLRLPDASRPEGAALGGIKGTLSRTQS